MIKIEKVNKYFYRHKKKEIHVINNTSLELGDNGLVALLGPSGCGKTTLLNAIGGLDKVNNGKIYINGKRITRKSIGKVDKIRNLNIGYIFQDYYLVDSMSVFDNVALVLKINGIKNKEEIKKRVNFVLEKVGMYRYRNRYANMLSGGERQRVGIARAIVKNPSIIIADEPTGNLDSKNSLEIMNIIKAISKNRLVLLVTHENELAEFYASRIIEIEDGVIKNDRPNEHTNDLDYRMDNKIYLKDFKCHKTLSQDNTNINYYSDTDTKMDINIVVQNGNIYIESKTRDNLEIVDDDSSIEFVDDHYKKISKSIYEEYNFDLEKVSDKSYKTKYSSIFNPITLIINGFKKVRDYTFIKKLLLIGFFASGMFIAYSISSVFGITNVKDENFVSINKDYLTITAKKIKVNKFLEYEKNENINYIIPGDSIVSFTIAYNDYLQSYEATGAINGSLSSISMIENKDIIKGRMPEKNNEIVLDKLTIKDYFKEGTAKQVGIIEEEDLLNREVTIKNMKPFVIVGIVSQGSPSIYAYEENFVNILANTTGSNEFIMMDVKEEESDEFMDYTLALDDISLKKGRYPTNDYEVILNYSHKDEVKLNKKIDTKINDVKLKVVGFYESKTNRDTKLVSNNTIKYHVILNKSDMEVYAKDDDLVLKEFLENDINIGKSYEVSRDEYVKSREKSVKSSLIFCLIILLISLIEIYLMIRSSFLSRIKEVGIFRAIGMKKRDIRKMFVGEIIAITTIGSLVGVILMTYILSQLIEIEQFASKFMINYKVFILTVLFVYLFNILVGLLPVIKTLTKRPAQILSRTDI